MTFQPMEPNSQPDFQPRPTRARGCLIGCAIVLILLVILAIFLGLFFKHVVDDVTGNNHDVTTTTPSPNAVQKTAVQYGQIVSGHATVLSQQANTIATQCKTVTKDKEPCRTAVGAMHDELAVFQTDLAAAKAPAALIDTDAKLRQAVVDGLNGTGDVQEGLDNHPIKLAKGLVEVTKAIGDLRGVEKQLNQDLGTSIPNS